MRKNTSFWIVKMGVGLLLALVLACAYFVHKERETLSRLVNPGSGLKSTVVYSRWLDLRPGGPITWNRMAAWLESVGYQSVPVLPAQPGLYHAAYPDLTIFARPFRYPDKDFPAQILHLEFSSHGLESLEAVAGHARLPEWRIDPKRLADWDAGGKTALVRVRVSDLPPYVPRAILAMEDKRFYQHGPFDGLGILRAVWVDLQSRRLRQGASTISQQLARSIFLDVGRTWRRKALEAALAIYLELRYAKPQLLEMYLNQVYWGQDGSQSLIGIEAVSQSLFGKAAPTLTVGESAVLAGMLQSPNRYSPRTAPGLVKTRKKVVLSLMRDQGVISKGQYKKALAETIHLAPAKKSSEATYFLAALHDQLSDRYVFPVFLSQGWAIFTTLDPLLQHEAVMILGRRSPGEAPQAGLVAIDPPSGAILAWVGGTNYQTNPFDHAGQAKRQPGSAFKPFVALAALESRKVTTATLLDDKPLTLQGQSGPWTPFNYDRQYRGRVSVWDSIVYSLNVPMVRLAMQVGIGPILNAAQRAGIQSLLRPDLSLALGTSEVSLVELTEAYATLAGGGIHHRAYSLKAIVGPDGDMLESYNPVAESAFAPDVVSLVTQMLEAVLDIGTGKAARPMGFTAPAAGKTGTSENFQDAWFLGYTTNLVCGVWVGYDKPKSLAHSAAGIALPLWTAFMKKAVALDPPRSFDMPRELVWETIDPESGLLARSGCIHRVKTAFLSGTQPTQDCPLHPGGIVGFFRRLTSNHNSAVIAPGRRGGTHGSPAPTAR